MKVKNVAIGIKSVEAMLGEARQVMERLERGEKVTRRRPGVYFDNLATMRKAITEERLRILRTIRAEHPASLYELAKILDRNLKNVCDDVNYLAELGLIELKKSRVGRERTIPEVNYERIRLEIPI